MKQIKIKPLDNFISWNFILDILKKNYEVEISDNPDYILCTVSSSRHLKYDNAVKIFYTSECQTGDFNLYDYVIGFDYMEFDSRYFRFPYALKDVNIEKLLTRGSERDSVDLNPNKKFCSFVFSNSLADPDRIAFFNKVSQYKHVDSGGRILNNVGGPVKDKVAFESNYKFHIVIENSCYPGYVTEKLTQSFSAGGIPIYHGDPYIDREFNTDAFIWIDQYNSWDDVIKKIKELDENDGLYLKMLNQPIFKSDTYVHDKFSDLESFLCNIFDQPKECAFRRNMSFHGKTYEKYFKRYAVVDDFLKSVYSGLSKLHR